MKPIQTTRSCALGTRPVVFWLMSSTAPCVQAANAGTMQTMEMFSEI